MLIMFFMDIYIIYSYQNMIMDELLYITHLY